MCAVFKDVPCFTSNLDINKIDSLLKRCLQKQVFTTCLSSIRQLISAGNERCLTNFPRDLSTFSELRQLVKMYKKSKVLFVRIVCMYT